MVRTCPLFSSSSSLAAALCLLFLLFHLAQGQLEVKKSAEAGPRSGHYTTTVSYRAVGAAGRIFNVRVVDSLPEELDLVSGQPVAKVDDPATDEWYHYSYVVRPRHVNITIAQPEAAVELPSAEVSYSTGGTNVFHTVYTEPVTLIIELPIPKGTMDLWPAIAFFTLALPVLAAYFFIPHASSVQKKRK